MTRPTENLQMRMSLGGREFGICRNAAGFTLVEVILIIVVVSIFMAAIGIPLLKSLRESDLPEIATIAYFLGLEKLEELAAQTTGSISAEAKAAVSDMGIMSGRWLLKT